MGLRKGFLERLDRASIAIASMLLKAKGGNATHADRIIIQSLADEIREKPLGSIFSDEYLDVALKKGTTREILALKLESVCSSIENQKGNPTWIEELIDTFEAISTLAQQELENRRLLIELKNARRHKRSGGSPFGEAGQS